MSVAMLPVRRLLRCHRHSNRTLSSMLSRAVPDVDTLPAAIQPHIPVLLHEILDVMKPVSMKAGLGSLHQARFPHIHLVVTRLEPLLVVTRMQVYVDCTLGAGGHASAMAQAHPVRPLEGRPPMLAHALMHSMLCSWRGIMVQN